MVYLSRSICLHGLTLSDGVEADIETAFSRDRVVDGGVGCAFIIINDSDWETQ